MPWLNDLKTRHEQQKEPNYLKIKPFPKSPNYFWNACKEMLKCKSLFRSQCFGSVFKKHCLGVSFLIGLQLC